MKAIILIVHGMPPKDFPQKEKLEFFRLHSLVENQKEVSEAQLRRHDELNAKMRQWPRTETNDPFETASYAIAESLKAKTHLPVYVGFNEFCAPDVYAAIDQAIAEGHDDLTLLTPMLTRGGSHAEEEIPELIEEAKQRHPKAQFTYAWPFETAHIADFLTDHLLGFIKQTH